MKIHGVLLFLAALVSTAVQAGEPSQFFGVWADKHKLGTVLTEFKANELVLSTVDSSGVSTKPPQTFPVSYETLSKSESGETFGVNFLDANGNKVGGIMVIVKDQNHILQVFPGAGSKLLEREP